MGRRVICHGHGAVKMQRSRVGMKPWMCRAADPVLVLVPTLRQVKGPLRVIKETMIVSSWVVVMTMMPPRTRPAWQLQSVSTVAARLRHPPRASLALELAAGTCQDVTLDAGSGSVHRSHDSDDDNDEDTCQGSSLQITAKHAFCGGNERSKGWTFQDQNGDVQEPMTEEAETSDDQKWNMMTNWWNFHTLQHD
jgi:hypothetical protein